MTEQEILSAIPEQIKQMYSIKIDKQTLYIHQPTFISINCIDINSILENTITVSIGSEKASIGLWKNSLIMHTTIF